MPVTLSRADLLAAHDALRRNLDNLRAALRAAERIPECPPGELAHRHACVAELEARVARFADVLSVAPAHLHTVVVAE